MPDSKNNRKNYTVIKGDHGHKLLCEWWWPAGKSSQACPTQSCGHLNLEVTSLCVGLVKYFYLPFWTRFVFGKVQHLWWDWTSRSGSHVHVYKVGLWLETKQQTKPQSTSLVPEHSMQPPFCMVRSNSRVNAQSGGLWHDHSNIHSAFHEDCFKWNLKHWETSSHGPEKQTKKTNL